MAIQTAQMGLMNPFKYVEQLKNVDLTSSRVIMENAFLDICNARDNQNALMDLMRSFAVSITDPFF